MKKHKNNTPKPLAFLKLLPSCLCAFVLTFFFSFPLHAQSQKTWQWVKQLGSEGWDITTGVTCDSKNNLYVVGSFYNTLHSESQSITSLGEEDIFIARFDDKGDIKDLWRAGGRGSDRASCFCLAPGNTLVLAGTVTDTATFGSLKCTGLGQQLFVASLTAKGKFNWVKSFNANGEAIIQKICADTEGNIYLTGVFSGTLTGDDQKVTSSGKKDIFLAKINKDGTLEKLISMGGLEDDAPGAISTDNAQNITIAGAFGAPFTIGEFSLTDNHPKAQTHAFILQLDKDFTPQWVNILSGEEYCRVSSLGHDAQDNLFVAGSFSLTLGLADTTVVSKGYTDAFLFKYAADGKRLWSRSFGTWYYDYANHLNVDKLGSVMVTGSLGDALALDSVMIAPRSKDNATLVIRFSAEGQAKWGDCISGQGRNFSDGSVLDSKGNLYLTGSFRGSFQKEGDELTAVGDQDVFLAKYYNCPTSKAQMFGVGPLCPGTVGELSIKHGYKDITWNDTPTGKTRHTVKVPGRYWVSMYDKKGCLLTDTVTIPLAPLPVFTLGTDTTLNLNDSLLLKAPQKYTNYHWQDHSSMPTYVARANDGKPGSAIYWLSVSDSLGCAHTDSIQVRYMVDPNRSIIENATLITYPNPTRNEVYWYLKSEKTCTMKVALTDEHGRTLYSRDIEHYSPSQVMQISLHDVPVGQYQIRLKNISTGEVFKTVRVIKQ
jgi:hypothetical protein